MMDLTHLSGDLRDEVIHHGPVWPILNRLVRCLKRAIGTIARQVAREVEAVAQACGLSEAAVGTLRMVAYVLSEGVDMTEEEILRHVAVAA